MLGEVQSKPQAWVIHRAYERGFRGYIVPGLGRPGRVQVATLSFGPDLSEGSNWSEDFFSSPNFGQNVGPNMSENLFFFALRLILG